METNVFPFWQSVIQQHGVDPTRLHMLYKAPPSEVLEWEDTSIIGMQRWLAKVLRLADAAGSSNSQSSSQNIPPLENMNQEERDVYRETHATIKQVTEALSTTFSLNTAISDLIKLSNRISSSSLAPSSPIYQHAVQSLVKMMAPMAPSLGEECWEKIERSTNHTSVFQQQWPAWEPTALVRDNVNCVIQVTRSERRVMFCHPAHSM